MADSRTPGEREWTIYVCPACESWDQVPFTCELTRELTHAGKRFRAERVDVIEASALAAERARSRGLEEALRRFQDEFVREYGMGVTSDFVVSRIEPILASLSSVPEPDLCVCGHTVWRHDGGGEGRCRDCHCNDWRPVGAGVLSRPECVFRRCPNPGNCQEECLHYSLPARDTSRRDAEDSNAGRST